MVNNLLLDNEYSDGNNCSTVCGPRFILKYILGENVSDKRLSMVLAAYRSLHIIQPQRCVVLQPYSALTMPLQEQATVRAVDLLLSSNITDCTVY